MNATQSEEPATGESLITSLEFWRHGSDFDIDVILDVDSFLEERLEANPALEERYLAYVEENGFDLDIRSAESFVDALPDAKGIYREGEPVVRNTYNGEDLLSSVLQFVYWTDEKGAHVLLQKHNGGDPRENYPAPKAFDLDDSDETSIFDNAKAAIYCDDCDKYWDTDDGCHWYPGGCCGRGHTELQSYPATDQRPNYPERPNPAQRTLPIDLPERPEPCAGAVWVDDNRNGHCPYCGGLLHVAAFPAS